jgi:acyl-CoA dehydrogenase
MNDPALYSPVTWLQRFAPDVLFAELGDYEHWWREQGRDVSDAVDRAGTPHLKMFDALGHRVDEIQFPPSYWQALTRGYEAGVVWRSFDQKHPSLFQSFALGYVTSFFDPGIYCPFTVTLSTAIPLFKYGDDNLRTRLLARMLAREGRPWQGATWMTEAAGGSDLGAGVQTVAREQGDGSWRLDGDKYFCSNVGAEVAVVAARPVDASQGVRGLRLFALPRLRSDGTLNYAVRRLKDKIATRSVPTGEVELRDSEAWMLGPSHPGVYLILEVLNVSRVANSVGAVALAQRAVADACEFAAARVAFGRPVIEQPLFAAQLSSRIASLEQATVLAWEAVRRLEEVWRERPPYSGRYHLFRLVAHLAKYWTAEQALAATSWAIQALGGVGTLQENRVERWLREALIMAVWEGTPHRHILDGLEVMERKGSHLLLFDELREVVGPREIARWAERIEALLALEPEAREAAAGSVFPDLAQFVAAALLRRADFPRSPAAAQDSAI